MQTNFNDIVITYREKTGSEEKLRQILRIIENEFTGFNEIVIVGDCPDWTQGVIKIPHSHSSDLRWKVRDSLNMLQSVCLNPDVSVNYLWIDQDDKLFKIDVSKGCRIPSNVSPSGVDKITFTHTKKILERRGFNYTNYFGNYPMTFSKLNIMKTFDLIDFETMYGYCIKTLYVNFNRYKPAIQDTPLDCRHYESKSSYEVTD